MAKEICQRLHTKRIKIWSDIKKIKEKTITNSKTLLIKKCRLDETKAL